MAGADLGPLRPGDAVAAVRSLPRRFGAAFAIATDDPDLDGDAADALVRRRLEPSGLSAVDHAVATADLLARTRAQARAVVRGDRPDLDAVPSLAGEPPLDGATASLTDVVAALGRHAGGLADDLEAAAPDDWGRAGALGGRDVGLLDLVRDAVAESVQHLRDTERTIREVRGRTGS